MPSDKQLELQPFTEFKATVSDFFKKRGVADNWLVGKGVILVPPFSLSFFPTA